MDKFLLKSVEDEEYAVDLIKRIQLMCVAGGPKLMMSIPENHKREAVKDADLIREKFPTERSLGVHWNVEKDELCF